MPKVTVGRGESRDPATVPPARWDTLATAPPGHNSWESDSGLTHQRHRCGVTSQATPLSKGPLGDRPPGITAPETSPLPGIGQNPPRQQAEAGPGPPCRPVDGLGLWCAVIREGSLPHGTGLPLASNTTPGCARLSSSLRGRDARPPPNTDFVSAIPLQVQAAWFRL